MQFSLLTVVLIAGVVWYLAADSCHCGQPTNVYVPQPGTTVQLGSSGVSISTSASGL